MKDNYIKLFLLLPFVTVNTHAMDNMGCHFSEDESGKKLPHMMSMSSMDSKYDQLRTKVAPLAGLSNDQINNMMKMMGPNYYWPIPTDNNSKEALIILAHGFGKQGDYELYNSMKDFGDDYLTSLSLGMSMMTSDHINCSLIDVKNNNVEKIYVVPVSSTPYNTLVRQWRYIFKLEKEPTYADVNQVDTQGVIFLETIRDNIYAKKILLEYAKEISSDEENEVVIIIAHGPLDADDNEKELVIMDNIGKYIMDNSEFDTVRSFTLQDDAGKEIRDKNVSMISDFINNANNNGKKVLMVSNLMSGKGIQRSIQKDFDGLDYTFNSKGLLTHPYFKEWIFDSIDSQ